MVEHWYVYLIIAVVSCLLYLACDNLNIIKSKPLRVFIIILVTSLICWFIYDLLI